MISALTSYKESCIIDPGGNPATRRNTRGCSAKIVVAERYILVVYLHGSAICVHRDL